MVVQRVIGPATSRNRQHVQNASRRKLGVGLWPFRRFSV